MAPSGDRPARIVLAAANPRLSRALQRIIRSMHCDLTVEASVASAAERSRASEFDLAVCSYSDIKKEGIAPAAFPTARHGVLLIIEEISDGDMAALFSDGRSRNLVANDSVVLAEELVVTIQKILRGDLFGLEKYMTWGVEPHRRLVHGTADRGPAIDAVGEFASRLGLRSRFAALAKTVADEMLTNGLFDAPVDAEGHRIFASTSRTADFVLPEGHALVLQYACDGRAFAISVADDFGSLSGEKVFSYLARCFRREEDQVERKLGGAGIGLYLVFESARTFVINLRPGRQTEMIAMFDVRNSVRDVTLDTRSFHLFVSAEQP
jgi:hypothetical protein